MDDVRKEGEPLFGRRSALGRPENRGTRKFWISLELLQEILGLPEDMTVGWVKWDLASGSLIVTVVSERWKDDPHVREVYPVVRDPVIQGGVTIKPREWKFSDG